jgi:hypothetical protein
VLAKALIGSDPTPSGLGGVMGRYRADAGVTYTAAGRHSRQVLGR